MSKRFLAHAIASLLSLMSSVLITKLAARFQTHCLFALGTVLTETCSSTEIACALFENLDVHGNVLNFVKFHPNVKPAITGIACMGNALRQQSRSTVRSAHAMASLLLEHNIVKPVI